MRSNRDNEHRVAGLECRRVRSISQLGAPFGRPQPPSSHSSKRYQTSAFTLLEVILALAILAGAVAALGELIRTGMLNAQAARNLTRAELVAETVVSEVMAGALATSASNTQWEEDPRWLYSVSTESASQTGLLALTVTVVRDATPGQRPVSYTIKRWMIDPGVEQQSEANAQAAEQNAASGSTPSSSSTGTGS